MKYLVNRVTKEHFPYNGSRKHGEKAVENGDYSLYVIEADSEGWIPHTGTECPLPDDVRCDIKCVDEKASLQARNANQWSWNKTNCFTDITHYRPILTEAEPRPTAETYLNAAEKILESKRDKLYTKEGGKAEPSPDYDPRSVSFNLLKRLQAAHEAAQTIPDLEAQLREVLAGMGYDLVARSPFVEPEAAVETEQDMSDWRNWREGDLVECVEGSVGCVSRGDLYKVEAAYPSDPHYVGICPDDNGVLGAYRPNRFRFHSRPAKGE